MNKQTITADHLNATHLGKLKKISADYASMPDFTAYFHYEENRPRKLMYRKDVHIILHLSNQANDDIKAIVHENTELQVEEDT